eukprot:421196-Hanusia_phi.AAC.5
MKTSFPAAHRIPRITSSHEALRVRFCPRIHHRRVTFRRIARRRSQGGCDGMIGCVQGSKIGRLDGQDCDDT